MRGSHPHRKPHRTVTDEEMFCVNSTKTRHQVRERILYDSLLPYNCAKCGIYPEWMGELLSLILDHINGIYNDHRLGNMRWLCPNCNSQTRTFSGRNKKYKIPYSVKVARNALNVVT